MTRDLVVPARKEARFIGYVTNIKNRSNLIIPVVYKPFYVCCLGTEKERGLQRGVRFWVVLCYKNKTLKLN